MTSLTNMDHADRKSSSRYDENISQFTSQQTDDTGKPILVPYCHNLYIGKCLSVQDSIPVFSRCGSD